MKYLYPLIILIVFTLSMSVWLANTVFVSPVEEAIAFLNNVKDGDLNRAVKRFGGNVCRCPAKGGWGSYLIYVSAQEPNLAFTVGRKFSIGTPVVHQVNKPTKHVVPWERPEDTVVDVPIKFEPNDRPYFLPMRMAYGYRMSEEQLQNFVKDPDKDAFKGFYLRLRPSLEPGAILPKKGAISEEAELEFQALIKDKTKLLRKDKDQLEIERKQAEQQAQELREMFGDEAADYVEPKDAGRVIRPDGTMVPLPEVAQKLPRLKSCLVRLHVVRKGQLKDWTIFHFAVIANVLDLPDGKELKLLHSQPPGYRMDEVRPQLKDDDNSSGKE
ncbi:MAG: hypothetical protein IAF58_05725 [Leptolyngbya sp.]|nr:hypothetical protein [Candidatus Melainabacteria bacterium]